MSKPVYNVVKRPGRAPGDADIEIPVAEDLVTVPGVPKRDADVAFYSREYPLQSQTATGYGLSTRTSSQSTGRATKAA